MYLTHWYCTFVIAASSQLSCRINVTTALILRASSVFNYDARRVKAVVTFILQDAIAEEGKLLAIAKPNGVSTE
jgi:hypothetical protein